MGAFINAFGFQRVNAMFFNYRDKYEGARAARVVRVTNQKKFWTAHKKKFQMSDKYLVTILSLDTDTILALFLQTLWTEYRMSFY